MNGRPVDLKIEHGATRYGRYTAVTYRDGRGFPMASLFAGTVSEAEAVQRILWCRKNDRNAVEVAEA